MTLIGTATARTASPTAEPSATMSAPMTSRVARAWAVLDGVLDPEVPALSVRDLGIVRDVREIEASDDGAGQSTASDAGESGEDGSGGDAAESSLEVVLTPTYSGCPATEVIEHSVLQALEAAGLGPVRATLQRAPAWSSDWISAEGHRKLREYGIAPPCTLAPGDSVPIRFSGRRTEVVPCPRCNSNRTERLSAFGSTACKSLYRCLACREPFEHFKPL